MSDLRDVLRANLFDGDESGVVTMPVATLLTDVVDIVRAHTLDLDSPEAVERLARAWGEVMDGRRIGEGLHAARINADTTTGADWAAILAALRGDTSA